VVCGNCLYLVKAITRGSPCPTTAAHATPPTPAPPSTPAPRSPRFRHPSVSLEQEAKSVDGSTKIKSIVAVRAEIYTPVDETNIQTTPLALEHIKVFAEGMLHTLENGQGARYVDDGEYSLENQTEEMIAAFEVSVCCYS
jgi:hypothetical protein